MKPVSKGKKTIDQYNADAGILAEFEQSGESGKSFDYSKSVICAPENVSDEKVVAYLTKIQRGGLVQPFGCMLAIEEPTFKIISYSENCFELLDLSSHIEHKELKCLIGVDSRTLFTTSSSASLAKATATKEISMLNPLWVYSSSTQKPFYAILHRIDVGIIIDLEPAKPADPALSVAGAVQSQKIAVRAISRLNSLPGGNMGLLCDTVVEDVQQLTGFDRVMIYKFHEDDHGEVVSEIRRSDLEPYLGLHYPATDVPQAARFLFKQSRVRMICDCNANQVRVIQSEELQQPLCLVNSTLRSPHDCHRLYMANMGSIASLVMSVIINSNDSMKLWGLVVCHHTSPRHVPFPLRYACEFLIQAFGIQLHTELQLASRSTEKTMLRTQTLLCDMLLRGAPSSIVTQSPSIMDLVKCDGAALYYGGQCWSRGVTPTELQVKDISDWLLNNHGDSTGLSTDSLAEASYPGALELGDAVCGMAAARITSNDFLFWFRSHTAKELKWGGAKHHPERKDDGGKMHPRSSFIVFLEVVKNKSFPWEVSEINAIHSLQIIMRESFAKMKENDSKELADSQKKQLGSVACEMVRLIETATAPIFGVDSFGHINGWNTKVAELTGLRASEAMGKSLVDEIVLEDSRTVVENLICRALLGEEDKNVEIKLKHFGVQQKNLVLYIVANACTSRDYKKNVKGVCFVGQDITPEKIIMDKFIRLQGDYKSIIQCVSPLIPPIFASDENACCSEWNAGMEKLTGWMKHEVVGKIISGEIFGSLCRLKGQNSLTKFMILLYQGITGLDTEKFPFGFFDRGGKFVEVFLTASRRIDADGNVIGCFCFLEMVVPGMQPALEGHRHSDKEVSSKLKEFAYIRQEVKNPLNGIRFIHKLLESTAVSENQKQFLKTSNACEKQIMTIIDDMDIKHIEEGSVELNMEEFLLGSILDVIISQVMILMKEKNLQLFREIPEEVKKLSMYGDKVRLQLVLSDFLLNVVHHAPSPNSWIEIKISPGLKVIKNGNEFMHVQFRLYESLGFAHSDHYSSSSLPSLMTHPGDGLPPDLVKDMFDSGNQWITQEGLGLNTSRKLLTMMNGHVNYIREHNKCYFLIDLELKTKTRKRHESQAGTSKMA